jgi:hypothetical protein
LKFRNFAVLFAVLLLILCRAGQAAASTVTLATSTASNPLGEYVYLTAFVTGGTTGRVTFYDGGSILGVRPVGSGGIASLWTRELLPGTHRIRAYYWGDGGSNGPATSNSLVQTVDGPPTIGLKKPERVNAPGSAPLSLIAGEIDNIDSWVDIVVANTSSNTVTMLRGNGSGGFLAPLVSNAGPSPKAMVRGDWNADGEVDLAVVNGSNGRINLLIGNGDGTFQSPVEVNPGAEARAIAVADYNGDGKADLAVGANTNTIRLLYGNGDGTFGSPFAGPAVSAATTWVVAADFNSDGIADLAVTCGENDKRFLLLGRGGGMFDAPVPATDEDVERIGSLALAAADFNSDGDLDFVVPDSGSLKVRMGGESTEVKVSGQFAIQNTLAYLASTTSLQSSPNPSVFGQSTSLTATVPSGATGKVAFYDGANLLGFGTVSGGQASFSTVLLPSGTRSLTARYTGDTTYATSVSNARAHAVNVVAAGGIGPVRTMNVPNGVGRVITGDFNRDGRKDIVVGGHQGVSVFLGNGNGTFQNPLLYGGFDAYWFGAGDVNSDGKSDLVFAYANPASTSNGLLAVMLGNGDGTFASRVTSDVLGNLQGNFESGPVGIADVNRDGKADLLILSRSPGVLMLAGNGDGVFRSPVVYSDLNVLNGGNLSACDFNGDGILDIYYTDNLGYVRVNISNGDGSYRNAFLAGYTGLLVGSFVAGDFDSDGKADLQVLYSNSAFGFAKGNGDGTFQPVSRTTRFLPSGSAGDPKFGVSAQDFNGDGKLDLAYLGNLSGERVTILYGNGDGTFASSGNLNYDASGQEMGLGDFNGDGRPDLALVSHTNGTLSVIPGTQGSSDLDVTVVQVGSPVTGSLIQFRVALRNPSNTNLIGSIRVSLALPQALNYGYANADGWTCNISACSGHISLGPGEASGLIEFGTGPNGATGTFTVTVYVKFGYYDLRAFDIPVTIRNGMIWELTASSNPAPAGRPVTFTAKSLSGEAIQGNVAFFDGVIPLGTISQASGIANFTTRLLTPGKHLIRATFLGNESFLPATTLPLTLTVNGVASSGFATPGTLVSGSGPNAVVTGDFNVDGRTDFATSNGSSGTVSVFLGNGNGTFATKVDYPSGASQPAALIATDLNNDSSLDLVAVNQSRTLSILYGNANGTFQSPVSLALEQSAKQVTATDFDRDGKVDLSVTLADGSLRTMLGNGNGTFRNMAQAPWSGGASYGTVTGEFGPVDQGGVPILPDLAFSTDYGLQTLLANGNGEFQGPLGQEGSMRSPAIAAGDWNGDGVTDLAGATGFGGLVTLVCRDYFCSIVGLYATDAAPNSLTAVDVNGDGKQDLVVTNAGASSFFVYMGNGNGTFQTQPLAYATAGTPVGSAAGDFNGDGRTDIVVVNSSNNTVQIFPGAALPALQVTSTHNGNFLFNQVGATYSLQVRNASASSVSGTFTVTDTLPAGLSATAMSGQGWTCTLGTLTCTQTTTLAAGATLPAINLTVNVNIGSKMQVTNLVAVSAANAAPASGTDVTFITALQPPALTSPANSQSIVAASNATLAWLASPGATGYDVYFGATPDPAFAGTTSGTTFVTGSLLYNVPYYWRVVAKNGAGDAASPIRTFRLTAANYKGYLDVASCQVVSGWIADSNRISQSINVKILDGSTVLGTVPANLYRPDVSSIVGPGDTGYHGFSFAFPNGLLRGTHTIRAQFEDYGIDIPGSPKTISCTDSYIGAVTSATCSGISGWAADYMRRNTAIGVTLWNGNTQIMTWLAAQYDPAAGAVVGDNGLHGFTVPIPAGLKDGVHRSLQVRYEMSSTQLSGSPVPLQCGGSGGGGTSYIGFVDAVSCANGISGWAADRNRLNQAINVTLWDGNTQVASTLANISRPDVGGLIGDNGLHGFNIPIPAGYSNGAARSLQVRFESSSSQLNSSPASFTCGTPSGGGGSTPAYTGFVDVVSCSNGISGWAADTKRLNQPIQVTLWDGVTQIASTTANISRPDVGGALGDNGLHGFNLAIPPTYADGVQRALQVRFETSTTQLNSSPVTVKCGTPSGGGGGGGGVVASYTGFVDSVSCTTGISGWAADRNRLNTPISVTLWDGNAQVGSTFANISRPDVGSALGDNGLHGFTIPIPAGYSNGTARSLQVRFDTSSTQLNGSPAGFTCGTPSGGGGGGVTPNFTGWVDSSSCTVISGWAADRNRLNQSIAVDLVEGSSVLASVLANGYRPDVGGALGDNGLHAFALTVPQTLKDGAVHNIQMRYGGSTTAIPNSPQTLQCASTGGPPPNFAGYVDQVGCSVISGWAADRNRPNTPIELQIYDGATLLGTVTANQSRPDVGGVLGDNGLHGFTFATPPSVKNGQPHTITVKPVGSSTALAGPQSVTCP